MSCTRKGTTSLFCQRGDDTGVCTSTCNGKEKKQEHEKSERSVRLYETGAQSLSSSSEISPSPLPSSFYTLLCYTRSDFPRQGKTLISGDFFSNVGVDEPKQLLQNEESIELISDARSFNFLVAISAHLAILFVCGYTVYECVDPLVAKIGHKVSWKLKRDCPRENAFLFDAKRRTKKK